MSRIFVKISKEDFREKLIDAIKKHEDCDEDILEELQDTKEGIYYGCSYILRTLNKKVDKDLGKVMFDLENFDCSQDNSGIDGYELGIRELDNGMVYLGCAAGGDWEYPVFFIIYWDGASFRGYIPSDGNQWNKKYKTAYGSEQESEKYDDEDEDESNSNGEPTEKSDIKKIKEDIKKRIVIK